MMLMMLTAMVMIMMMVAAVVLQTMLMIKTMIVICSTQQDFLVGLHENDIVFHHDWAQAATARRCDEFVTSRHEYKVGAATRPSLRGPGQSGFDLKSNKVTGDLAEQNIRWQILRIPVGNTATVLQLWQVALIVPDDIKSCCWRIAVIIQTRTNIRRPRMAWRSAIVLEGRLDLHFTRYFEHGQTHKKDTKHAQA